MKALTVQQPWAWAIIHGGKSVENRTQAWSYRGPLAIHAECCQPWGETSYAEHGGRTRRDIVHLVLANPIALTEPVPCPGALGLWSLDRGARPPGSAGQRAPR